MARPLSLSQLCQPCDGKADRMDWWTCCSRRKMSLSGVTAFLLGRLVTLDGNWFQVNCKIQHLQSVTWHVSGVQSHTINQPNLAILGVSLWEAWKPVVVNGEIVIRHHDWAWLHHRVVDGTWSCLWRIWRFWLKIHFDVGIRFYFSSLSLKAKKRSASENEIRKGNRKMAFRSTMPCYVDTTEGQIVQWNKQSLSKKGNFSGNHDWQGQHGIEAEEDGYLIAILVTENCSSNGVIGYLEKKAKTFQQLETAAPEASPALVQLVPQTTMARDDASWYRQDWRRSCWFSQCRSVRRQDCLGELSSSWLGGPAWTVLYPTKT